jgi:hypothetical protein
MGSGHPTRIICSALIAQAFDSVRYPILPMISRVDSASAREELLVIRHSSLYAPRDFDISPYFEVVKPTIKAGFDYKKMRWANLPKRARPAPRPIPTAGKSPPLAPDMPAEGVAQPANSVEAMLNG